MIRINRSTAHAIETHYSGYRFRSRLEARWAVFFDALGIKWDYEPEGYVFEDGTKYLPDFWLPDVIYRDDDRPGVWLEVKGIHPNEEETAKLDNLSLGTERPAVIAIGMPSISIAAIGSGELWEAPANVGSFHDKDMAFMTGECKHTRIHYASEGSYQWCPICGCASLPTSDRIYSAIAAARSARFEYGETPQPLLAP